MCFIIPTFIGYLFGLNPILSFLLCFTRYVFLLNATWCVNSICHMIGTRPWNPNILPADNYFVSLITAGEGWHNFHHEYPFDWKASKDEWWMFNPTRNFISFFEKIGLADTT